MEVDYEPGFAINIPTCLKHQSTAIETVIFGKPLFSVSTNSMETPLYCERLHVLLLILNQTLDALKQKIFFATAKNNFYITAFMPHL